MNIPSTQDLSDQNLSVFESQLTQTSPLNSKAFLRVLAVLEALAFTGMYKYAVDQSKQNLALTARGSALDDLGDEYDTPRKGAVATVLTATLPATNGVVIPTTGTFVGVLNGIIYILNTPSVSVGGIATLLLTALEVGVVGNLSVGDSLNIISQVAGASTVASVTAINTTGADQEIDDDYAPRVQFAVRSTQGGGNATDYKTWAEAVAGVVRAYPYSGKPFGSIDTSYPGDRTVYVQVNTDLDPDGIPSSDMLDEVRTALNLDPITGLSRPALGLVDDTLSIVAITRSEFDVEVVGLVVPSGMLASVESQIFDALTTFFTSVYPYILGVDLPQDQNDTITPPLVNQVVQDVLTATGSSASAVQLNNGGIPVISYRLNPGELAKLGSLTYS